MRDIANITGPTRADSAPLAESCLAGLLSFVFGDLHARRLLAVSAASRRADGWPAWYVWMAGSLGAHELALVPACPSSSAPPDETTLEFAIRYFPSPQEPVFARFAPIERSARVSMFDCTGTPAVGAFADLEPSLFHVGTLAMRITDGLGIDLCLETQDEWRERVTTPTGDVLRRAVPGADLAAPMLDLVVRAHALAAHSCPRRAEVRRRPGLVWRIGPNGDAVSEIAPDLSAWAVSAFGLPRFGVPFTPSAAPEGMFDLDDGGDLVFAHEGEGPAPAFPPFDVRSWWAAGENALPASGRMCGCHVPEDGGASQATRRRLHPTRLAGASP